ncbi:MAG: hypothetical protein U0Q55_09300 [Vicinamibacterales bacterium]
MAFPIKTIPGLASLYATALSVAVLAVTAGAPRNWAVSIPDATHTYGIRFRTGADAFFRPPVGWFIDHGYQVCLALLVVTLAAEAATRLIRPRPAEPPDTPSSLRG